METLIDPVALESFIEGVWLRALAGVLGAVLFEFVV